MFDGLIQAFNEFLRSLLWELASLFLSVLDFLWEIVLKVATLNLGDLGSIDTWFAGIVLTFVLFVTYRALKICVRAILEEDYRDKIEPGKMVMRFIVTLIIITVIPLSYKGLCSVTSEAVDKISYFIPSLESSGDFNKISNVLIQSGRTDITNIRNDLGPEIKLNEDFDINNKDENGNFLYFPTYSSIFLIIAVSCISLVIFITIALQVGKRLFSILTYYLLSPYAAASYLEPDSQTFSKWLMFLLSDLGLNFFQIYMTYFVLVLCNSNIISEKMGSNGIGIFAQIILFIAGILFLQDVPSKFTSLLGGSGDTTGLRQLMETSNTQRAILGGAAGGLATGMAYGVVGTAGIASGMAGAKNGIQSGGGLKGALSGAKRGFASAMPGARNNSQSRSGSSDASRSSNEGSTNSAAYNAPPTNAQLNAAEYYGIDGAENMSRGDLSKALENVGVSPSYFNDNSDTQQYASGGNEQLDDMANPSTNAKKRSFISRGGNYLYNVSASRIATSRQYRQQRKMYRRM